VYKIETGLALNYTRAQTVQANLIGRVQN
jgi:hypothetical protein